MLFSSYSKVYPQVVRFVIEVRISGPCYLVFIYDVFVDGRYPQFAQQTNAGVFMQQDAEECWTQLIYSLSQGLQASSLYNRPSASLVKELFGIEYQNTVKCTESGESSTETETVFAMKCHISQEVNHLHEGLKHGLKGELEKTSQLLGRSALFIKESHINKLPQYLTVQFVRFFWKRESNQKAKILRKVGYPLVLDVLEFCTDELKEKLVEPRKTLLALEEAKAGIKRDEKGKGGAEGVKALETSTLAEHRESEAMDVDSSATSSSAKKAESEAPAAPQVTGFYDLVAVLTHKGRSADSGHYVSWVNQENGKWIEFDDDQPIVQREENITNLSGGGDWHMAYICLYKARTVTPV
jgi:ubiquitin carboxyl-terminal hydrolase 14